MAFRILSQSPNQDTLGQSWLGDEWDENIRLCEYQTIRKAFFDHLPKTGKILEAGCGLGRWVFYLREKGYDIIGIEASANALSITRLHDPKGLINKGDVRKFSFNDNSFDAVISLGVMEHFEEGPEHLLRETNRILAEKGLLFVSIPPNNLVRKVILNPLLLMKYYLKRKMGKKLVFAEYRFSEKEFALHLKKAGFLIKKTFTDELEPPKNIGLYVDFHSLRSAKKNWQLTVVGLFIDKVLRAISPSLHRGGVMFLCQKG